MPFWAKDIKVGFANINAKAEGIDTKPAFREAFNRRRCLIPFDRFFAWKKLGKERQPYVVALADCRLMALAGLARRGAARSRPAESAAGPLPDLDLTDREKAKEPRHRGGVR